MEGLKKYDVAPSNDQISQQQSNRKQIHNSSCVFHSLFTGINFLVSVIRWINIYLDSIMDVDRKYVSTTDSAIFPNRVMINRNTTLISLKNKKPISYQKSIGFFFIISKVAVDKPHLQLVLQFLLLPLVYLLDT